MDTTVLIDDVDTNRDAWLEIRKSRVGSSDISAILGLSSYRSRLDVWLEKRGEVEPKEDSLRLRMGRVKEPIIAQIFGEETGLTIWRAGEAIENPMWPGCMATPDYYYEKDGMTGVLEIKNVGSYSSSQWEDGNVPDHAHCQAMWQMGITGKHRGIVCALIGDSELKWKEIEFDSDLFAAMVSEALKFLEMVKEGVPPEATHTDLKAIRDRFDADESKNTELTVESQPFVDKWLKAKEEKDKLSKLLKVQEELMADAQANILIHMGDAAYGVLGSATITAKKSFRKAYTVKEASVLRFDIKTMKEGEVQ